MNSNITQNFHVWPDGRLHEDATVGIRGVGVVSETEERHGWWVSEVGLDAGRRMAMAGRDDAVKMELEHDVYWFISYEISSQICMRMGIMLTSPLQGIQGASNKNWVRNTGLAFAGSFVVMAYIFNLSRKLEQR
eukprot:753656-Hanusia_phi.AAC.14